MQTDPADDMPELDEAEPAPLSSPGTLLKEERERQGRSEKEIADHLHITMHYVRSIEADRYEKLPGTVFARGYIKSYALLLGLSADELLSLYDSFMEEKDEARQEVSRRIAARRQKDRNLPWLVFSVVAFLLGFMGLWAFNHFFVAAEGMPALNVGSERIQASPAIARAPVPATPRIIEAGGPGPDVLQIRFSGESWIEVSDEASMPLYRDFREAGDLLQITGDAPFQVLLGDAPYASVQLNGEAVDVGNNIRIDNSARLTVGL